MAKNGHFSHISTAGFQAEMSIFGLAFQFGSRNIWERLMLPIQYFLGRKLQVKSVATQKGLSKYHLFRSL